MTVVVVDAVADGSVDDRLSGVPRSLSDFQPSLKTRTCFTFCLGVLKVTFQGFSLVVIQVRLTRYNRYDNRDSFTHFELGLFESNHLLKY